MAKYVRVFIPQHKGVVYPQRVTRRKGTYAYFYLLAFWNKYKKNTRSILKSRKGHFF